MGAQHQNSRFSVSVRHSFHMRRFRRLFELDSETFGPLSVPLCRGSVEGFARFGLFFHQSYGDYSEILGALLSGTIDI